MQKQHIESRGLVLLGCGKMGSAMLAGWLEGGLPASSVWVMDPKPSDWLKQIDGLHLNEGWPENPAMVLIAVKPQMMADALPDMQPLGNGETLFVSVAAGTPIAYYERVLGQGTSIVRAMPNTPAAVGRGITALIGNSKVSEVQLALAEEFLTAVGQTVRLDDESQMDAVTAVSGSGPAYVFHLIETLAAAGQAQGLPEDLAMRLAKATVAGAGHLAENSEDDPTQLRVNVTSPAGTTAAALDVLMDKEFGFPALLERAVAAAANRSRELAQ
ncbi:pyrroline-5-carboxylate reductase [Qingshengfaniella alkalisoli]|uniref:Pyrroline-5-carboxylate reductase n=1 Tax=Qingshengfaniella alkalisoli TaxID=2599296 RepID=A0A5B8IUC6_9RHOB|nr:pyrroline-5-carboxylate reductase [Qingshengfaniella alkalisoli]QDY68461.1 pyrroline-5-carboxylate reductase [Qingshengfaniella alkalisoli]